MTTKRVIPGTTVFDGAQARRGLALNKMCFSLNQAANREAFSNDLEEYMERYHLDDVQKEALRDGSVLALIEAGGSIYYLAKVAAVLGWDIQDIGAAQTGLTKDEFIARLLSARN